MKFHKNYLAPSFPSNPLARDEMLKIAEIVPGKDIIYDVGSMDGRIVIRAVQEPFNAAYAVGIEIDDYWAQTALERVKELGLQDKVKIINKDVFKCDLSGADVLTLYLGVDSNEKLRPKLEKELKENARVVCNQFKIEKWKPVKVVEVNAPLGDQRHNFCSRSRPVYLYRIDSI